MRPTRVFILLPSLSQEPRCAWSPIHPPTHMRHNPSAHLHACTAEKEREECTQPSSLATCPPSHSLASIVTQLDPHLVFQAEEPQLYGDQAEGALEDVPK
jgi:hypothetical protein